MNVCSFNRPIGDDVRPGWIWIAASTLLLVVGAVTAVGTLGWGAVVVHGEPLGFCMSQQIRDGSFGIDMVVGWNPSLIPFGLECRLVTDSGLTAEFYDFGTGSPVTGLIVVLLASVRLALAIARFRSLSRSRARVEA